MKHPNSSKFTTEYIRYVTYRISHLSAKMNAQGAKLLSEQVGLSVVRWRLLALVAESEPVTSTKLVNAIEMDAGQFSRNLKAMIEEGLIISQLDKLDNRQHTLTLSKLGRSRYSKAEPIMKKRRESIIAGISIKDRDTFFRALDQIEKNLNASQARESDA